MAISHAPKVSVELFLYEFVQAVVLTDLTLENYVFALQVFTFKISTFE